MENKNLLLMTNLDPFFVHLSWFQFTKINTKHGTHPNNARNLCYFYQNEVTQSDEMYCQ